MRLSVSREVARLGRTVPATFPLAGKRLLGRVRPSVSREVAGVHKTKPTSSPLADKQLRLSRVRAEVVLQRSRLCKCLTTRVPTASVPAIRFHHNYCGVDSGRDKFGYERYAQVDEFLMLSVCRNPPPNPESRSRSSTWVMWVARPRISAARRSPFVANR